MIGRLWKLLGLVAAALVVAMPTAAQPSAAAPLKDQRIVAIGDLHGDFDAWRAIARGAGLIDRRGRWIGGRTVLVQTGDVADRGPDTLKIIEDLMRLQKEAPSRGGRVVTLVGNHEAMNITGDLRYVSAAEYAAFVDGKSARLREQTYARSKAAIEAAYRQRDPALTEAAVRQAWLEDTPLGFLEHRAAWRPDGRIGRWIAGNPAVAQLDGSLFVHGGICPPYVGTPLAELNRQVAAALAARAAGPEAIINDPVGPLWCRSLAGTEPAVGEQLDKLLAAYGAKRIVIGHTPILSGIAVVHEGRLVRIDTGISAVYGGKLSYLEIVDGTVVGHAVERPAPGQKGAM